MDSHLNDKTAAGETVSAVLPVHNNNNNNDNDNNNNDQNNNHNSVITIMMVPGETMSAVLPGVPLLL